MPHQHLPASTTTLRVDVSGAEIVNEEEAPETSDIYLPKHTEFISHIALDIGGSLAKIVYFTRPADPPLSTNPSRESPRPEDARPLNQPETVDRTQSSASHPASAKGIDPNGNLGGPHTLGSAEAQLLSPTRSSVGQSTGILTPTLVRDEAFSNMGASQDSQRQLSEPGSYVEGIHEQVNELNLEEHIRGAHSTPPRVIPASSIPGGRLNFTKFETECIESECIPFIINLIEVSAKSNGVPISSMKRAVKIILTGGGAYMYYDRIKSALGGDVDVSREEEMDCLITGLNFLTEIPREVFWFSDELVQEIVQNNPSKQSIIATSSQTATAINSSSTDPIIPSGHSNEKSDQFPRPSPNPPRYSVIFETETTPQFPFMLVNIGSGVSIIKVSGIGEFERISGTSLGGGTLWGLLSLLTDAKSFDEMLDISLKGDNSKVDMLVGDIYGQDYEKIGLKSSVIASSFGKVFKKGDQSKERPTRSRFSQEDISKSLLYAISNNIGQIA